MDSVVLSTWYKRVGDVVKSGEPLFAIETDKATLDIEAQADGLLAEVAAVDGETVPVLSVIGIIAAPGESAIAYATRQDDSQGAQKVVSSQQALVRPDVMYRPTGAERERIFISPRARRLAEAEHMDWSALSGTGPLGAIVERDVRLVLSELRKSREQDKTTRRLETAKTQSPAAISAVIGAPEHRGGHLACDVDASAVVELRERLARRKVTVTHDGILLYVLARAMHHIQQFGGGKSGVQIGIVTSDNDKFTMKRVNHVERMALAQVCQVLSGQAQTELDSEPVDAVQLLFFNIAEYGLDMGRPAIQSVSAPVLTAGRVRRTKSGDAYLWLALDYNPDQLADLVAMRLMQSCVQLLEDPDLLI